MTLQKPPAFILVLLHSVFLLVYAFHGVQNGVQAFFSLFVFLILLGISSVFHLIFWLATRKRSIKNIIRIPIYSAPVLVFLLMGILLPRSPHPVNQTSRLPSPSKRFTMTMEMKHNRWIVSIFDKSDKLLYRDNNSSFLGHLNVYWVWDKADRLWLYNSDSGFVYYWTSTPQGWKKVCWGAGHEQKSAGNFSPPEALYPDYAKKKP
ncbi:MAG TPA: hypothetical protein VHV83_19135 [Armatimonadota bacterium]|nr:hypothetical protein [Armatimonadota bacterium]